MSTLRRLDPIARERETISDLAAGSPLTYAQIRDAYRDGTLTATLANLKTHQRIAAAAVYAERMQTSISDALMVFGRVADLAGQRAADTVPVEPVISAPDTFDSDAMIAEAHYPDGSPRWELPLPDTCERCEQIAPLGDGGICAACRVEWDALTARCTPTPEPTLTAQPVATLDAALQVFAPSCDLLIDAEAERVVYDPEVRAFAMYHDGDLVGFARSEAEGRDTLAELATPRIGSAIDPDRLAIARAIAAQPARIVRRFVNTVTLEDGSIWDTDGRMLIGPYTPPRDEDEGTAGIVVPVEPRTPSGSPALALSLAFDATKAQARETGERAVMSFILR